MSTPTLSIQDCIAEFERQAARADADHKACFGIRKIGGIVYLTELLAWKSAAQFLREHAVLRWTADPPTVPGMYWHRLKDSDAEPTIRRLGLSGLHAPYVFTDEGWVPVATLDRDINQWVGPLPEPVDDTQPSPTPSP